MKLTGKSFLPLVLSMTLFLSSTLIAQSPLERPKAEIFPSQITHVVVIFQENRTPDNLFHFLSPLCPIPGGTGPAACTPSPVTTSCYDISPCGLSNMSGTDVPVMLTPVPLQGSNDPSHRHQAFYEMCDPDPANGYACRNDGAWNILPTNDSYAYVENTQVVNYNGQTGYLLDPYLTYAEQYGWANYMYQTNQGPSYPAHQFIFSGTSARSATEDAHSTFISDNYKPKHTEVGCLAPADATTTLLSPLLSTSSPCTGGTLYDGNSVQECLLTNTALDFPTNPVGSFCDTKTNMGAVLDAQPIPITWKYYAPSAGSIWTAPNSIQDICVPQFTSDTDPTLECTGTEWTNKVDLNLKGADVLNDITNCNLAGVSWVIPDGTWSDHAGKKDAYGPSWVAAVINAIGENPACPAGTLDAGQTFWNNTAIIVTWDDWGGWSDNQPPPLRSALPCTSDNCQGDYQLGFRVPMLVVSAYTPAHHIDDGIYDFGSILRTIEAIYGIPEGTMGVADLRSTTDLSSFFINTGVSRPYTPVPAVKDASYFLGIEAQKGPPVPPDNDGDDD